MIERRPDVREAELGAIAIEEDKDWCFSECKDAILHLNTWMMIILMIAIMKHIASLTGWFIFAYSPSVFVQSVESTCVPPNIPTYWGKCENACHIKSREITLNTYQTSVRIIYGVYWEAAIIPDTLPFLYFMHCTIHRNISISPPISTLRVSEVGGF